MEKEILTTNRKIKTVAITGPESTGKSVLSRELAEHYKTTHIPEFARKYIEGLDRAYNYDDIELIARQQVIDLEEQISKANEFVFADTYLIITKVWFDVVYKKCPSWVIDEIKKNKIDLFLLCDTSLPWIPDNVRENGGEMREILYKQYIYELEQFKLPYKIVTGTGVNRLQSAVNAINSFFGKNYT